MKKLLKKVIRKKLITLSASAIVLSTTLSFSQTTNAYWIKKSDPPFEARWGAVSFSIGDKGYVGSGYTNGSSLADFYAYNQATDSWKQVASLPDDSRRYAASTFTIGDKGYVCFGIKSGTPFLTDIWEYDPLNDTWTKKADFPGTPRYGAAAFSIGGKGYVVCGNTGTASGPYTSEVWEFDPIANTWTKKNDFPGSSRYGFTQAAVVMGGKAYLGGAGGNDVYTNDFYEYDALTDTWTKKADIPFGGAGYASAFKSCNRYILGVGNQGPSKLLDTFWEYNPTTNTWSQTSDLAGGKRDLAVSLSINGKGYCGTGRVDATNSYDDWWEFNCGCEVTSIAKDYPATNKSSLAPTIFKDFTTVTVANEVLINNGKLRIFDPLGRVIKEETLNTITLARSD